MFAIPGRPAVTCEGVTRREWLRIGGLAGIGGAALGLSELMAGRAVAADGTRRGEGFGRAKNCIVVFLFGAPAHQDTWDLKPSAPAEIRGEFQPISTSVPGIQVCEHMPLLARQAHRYLQIRSVTHPDNTHTVAMHYMLTGVRHRRPQTNPQNAPDDFPCLGAVLNYDRRGRPSPTGLPPAVSLNAPANQVSANNHIFPGFFAGFLGSAYEPMFVSQHANQADFQPLPASSAASMNTISAPSSCSRRPRLDRHWISAAKRRRCESDSAARLSDRAACWRGAWSRPACRW
jgi:hypothetical protein